jgi:hypothetical protein
MIDVIPTRKWVSANLAYLYSLNEPRELLHGPSCVESLLTLLKQRIPVILNLYLFENQTRFFESHDLLVSGYGNHNDGIKRSRHSRQHDSSDMSLVRERPITLIDSDSFVSQMRLTADGIAAKHIVFPSRRGKKQERGHCVLAIGFFVVDGTPFLKCRNHFGRRWGHNGDFSIKV